MLNDVNSTDLYGAIELGCQTMGRVFNKDDNDIPFMHTSVWPKARFGYSDKHAESHVPGRHLNALIAAENLAGIKADEDVIKKHAAAARYSFSGPFPLPLNRLKKDDVLVGDPVFFVQHNVREGLHALYALACFRNDEWAHEMMKRAIDFIFAHFVPQMAWDDRVVNDPRIVFLPEPFYIQGIARAIGPLVKYYKATDYEPALRLAKILAIKAVEHYPPSGVFDQEIMKAIHAHSITCVLSSLAQLAKATDDDGLMGRVRKFYDNGLNSLRNELGWAAEKTNRAEIGRGEVNISGDILETALILGEKYGEYYYDDAERILRGHILPSQLRDISFIVPHENPNGLDQFRNVAERCRGAFGFPSPFGHQTPNCASIGFNMDIVGGTVASLCEAYAACTSYKNGTHRINLLFDIETDAVKVISPYPDGEMKITLHREGDLYVRIPSWADRSKLSVTGGEWRIEGDSIYLQDLPQKKEICVTFPMEDRDVILHHSMHTLRARMKGDVVQAMDDMGMDFTFFPSLREIKHKEGKVMKHSIKAVLFDMDGVLANSEIYTARAAALTFNRMGVPAKEEDFTLFRGMGADDYLRGVLKMYGREYDASIKTDLYKTYGEIVSETDISIKGAAETVTALKKAGFRTAVCSSADREKLEINVRAIGLDVTAFDVILSGSDVKRQKPAPDVYLLGAEKVGCLPTECIVIEDALSGITSAHAAGMECIAITSSFSEETLREKAQPEYIISELREIIDIVI